MKYGLARICISLAVGALVVSGCTTTISEPDPRAGGAAATSQPPIPQVEDPTQRHCGELRGGGGTCSEWSALQPRPSLRDIVAIIGQHGDQRLGGLFLCSQFPPTDTDRLLGPESFRVIVNDFVCVIHSKDNTRTISISFGDGSIRQFSQADLRILDPADRGRPSTFQGRDALLYDRPQGGFVASRRMIISIPGVPDHVLIAELVFFPRPSESGLSDPDEALATRTFDFVTSRLVQISN